MRGGVIDGFVRLDLTLEVLGLDQRREVERRTAKLRDAILTDLHALLPLRRTGHGGKLSGSDIAAIKVRLQKILDAQVGPGIVRDVLLEEAHEIPGKPPEKPRS
jgi:hypothetical protein